MERSQKRQQSPGTVLVPVLSAGVLSSRYERFLGMHGQVCGGPKVQIWIVNAVADVSFGCLGKIAKKSHEVCNCSRLALWA